MNLEVANAMSGYIETLYNLNKNFIKLCGFDIMISNSIGDKEILDIIQEIPRVIPYSYSSKTGRLEYKNRDGLLEYCDELIYLKDNYDAILENNYDFLFRIKQIRNKYEHKMHGVKYLSSTGGSPTLFDFVFQVENKVIKVKSCEFIDLFKQINGLFSKIVKEIQDYAWDNGKGSYPYYGKITRFDFEDFNLLYDSTLLKKIGQFMNDF
jgi:hypothetical protein